MANTLTFSNRTIGDANIFGGVRYLVDLNDGEEFSIGNTASASVTFMTDLQVPLYSKDPLLGTFTWKLDNVNRGTFYVTEVTKSNNMYTVTAYDGMILLDTSIAALGITTFPVTATAALNAIASYTGYTISGTLKNGSMTCIELDDATSIRQLLGYIAEISGASVKLDATNKLCLMYYADSGITLTASDYKEIEAADYICAAINCVKIVGNDGEVKGTAGSGDNTLYISGNPFADSAVDSNAQTILSTVGNIAYTPLTCSLFGENGLSVGTGATFGSNYTLIMHIDASTEEGVTVQSVGNDTRDEFNKSLDLQVYEAIAIAKNANETAEEINDYFWTTSTDTGFGSGAHVTQKRQSQVLADPTHAGGNLLAQSDGIKVRTDLTDLATFGTGGMELNTVDDGGNLVDLAYIGYDRGIDSTGGLSYGVFATIGGRTSGSTIGNFSTAFGSELTASGFCAQAEGRATQATGPHSHAEGYGAKAIGSNSHAEGFYTEARKENSHASGKGTIADGLNQTVIGQYNATDTSSLFIIGKGSSNGARSNAMTVSGTGNATFAGSVTSAGHQLISRNFICYANSRVDTFTNGYCWVSLSSFGISTGQKPVGILLTHQDGGNNLGVAGKRTVILSYDYDQSDNSDVLIRAYNEDGSEVNGLVRYFAAVFQNSWTSA